MDSQTEDGQRVITIGHLSLLLLCPKKQGDNTKMPPKTSITQRLRTASWSKDSHPTGVVKPVNGIPTLPFTSKVV